jgi:hypothetical protein
MQVTIRLMPDRLNHGRMPVTYIAYADAANSIKKFFPRSIKKINALCPVNFERQRRRRCLTEMTEEEFSVVHVDGWQLEAGCWLLAVLF